jgi:tRNA(adenine34) deaminase
MMENEFLTQYMRLAIEQAKISLREGNHGFGAVIIKEGAVIAAAHDTEETEHDPTAHAEMRAIQQAARLVGKNLANCLLIATHEPCPMCATAIIWANIAHIGFGYAIAESLKQGRRRINLACAELFARAQRAVVIAPAILDAECAVLYNQDVRQEIKRLRNVTAAQLRAYAEESRQKRVHWFQTEQPLQGLTFSDPKETGYQLLLKRFKISAAEAPIVQRDERQIVFHSQNFCPTLEACKILELDTRDVCKQYNEASTEQLLKQIDPRLRFTRNYEKLRPYTPYCEELISIGA